MILVGCGNPEIEYYCKNTETGKSGLKLVLRNAFYKAIKWVEGERKKYHPNLKPPTYKLEDSKTFWMTGPGSEGKNSKRPMIMLDKKNFRSNVAAIPEKGDGWSLKMRRWYANDLDYMFSNYVLEALEKRWERQNKRSKS